MPAKRYDALSRIFGRRFFQTLTVEIMGVWQHRWNTERFIVFQMVTLQCARHVTNSCEIRRRIDQRLDAWEAGEHMMLVEDTVLTCEAVSLHQTGGFPGAQGSDIPLSGTPGKTAIGSSLN